MAAAPPTLGGGVRGGVIVGARAMRAQPCPCGRDGTRGRVGWVSTGRRPGRSSGSASRSGSSAGGAWCIAERCCRWRSARPGRDVDGHGLRRGPSGTVWLGGCTTGNTPTSSRRTTCSRNRSGTAYPGTQRCSAGSITGFTTTRVWVSAHHALTWSSSTSRWPSSSRPRSSTTIPPPIASPARLAETVQVQHDLPGWRQALPWSAGSQAGLWTWLPARSRASWRRLSRPSAFARRAPSPSVEPRALNLSAPARPQPRGRGHRRGRARPRPSTCRRRRPARGPRSRAAGRGLGGTGRRGHRARTAGPNRRIASATSRSTCAVPHRAANGAICRSTHPAASIDKAG